MVRILHVSDVHFGVYDPKSEQALIADALVRAVLKHRLNPDLIVFSGDLAFSGKLPEFETGERWLKRLCAAAPEAELLIVPGNHDVNRDEVSGPHLLHAAGFKEKSYNDWKKERKEQAPRHLETFFAWLKRSSGELPIRGAWNSPYGFHYGRIWNFPCMCWG